MTLYNLTRSYTATVGTGDVTLGAAVPGYNDWTGISGAVSYGLANIDSTTGAVTASEVGHGTVTAGVLSRDTVLSSTASGAKINLSNAQVYVTVLAQDLVDIDVIPTIAETEIDFGNAPAWSAEFTVSAATCTVNSKVTVAPSGNVATGRVGNDWVWDSLLLAATPGAGSFVVSAVAFPGPVMGKRKIIYTINN
jgi:hypothetical protein